MINRSTPTITFSLSLLKQLFAILTCITIPFILNFLCYQPLLAASPPPVQTFYIPLPEDQIFTSLSTIVTPACGSNSQPGEPIFTYISIVAIADNTLIYYDHWEDGFEANISNPTQSTTQIWGDGNPANGFPPGFPADIVNDEDVIILDNDSNNDGLGDGVVTSTLQSVIDFDGGDKLASSKTIAMSRAAWADGTSTLLAGALEMYDTQNWGTLYHAPIGENTPSSALFEYTGLAIMATQDGTIVTVDADNDGSAEHTTTLNQGQSYLVNGGVNAGATVSSSAAVQVALLTGDRCDSYESRWFTLFPDNRLSHSYYSPVSTPVGNATDVFLYNPDPMNTITVQWITTSGAQPNITLGPGAVARQTMPNGSGARFFTAGNQAFAALTAIESDDAESGNDAHDWGFTLIPEDLLTPQALIGWGPGNNPLINDPENSSPVWIMPVLPNGGTGSVNICADYDGDGLGALTDPSGSQYDELIVLNTYANRAIYDSDGDQTGMIIYVCDTSGAKLAVAWGQDPATASLGSPAIDVGTGIPPLPSFAAGKSAQVVVDLDSDGEADPGDTILYTVIVQNNSRVPVPDIIISDTLPLYTSYISNTTAYVVSGPAPTVIPDGLTGSAFPLDGGGFNLGILPVQGTLSVTFQILIDPIIPATVDKIANQAIISAADEVQRPEVETPLDFDAAVQINKLTNGVDADQTPGLMLSVGAPVTWTYLITNIGPVALSNILVTDNVAGVNPTYVSGDTANIGALDPGESWLYQATGNATAGQYTNIGMVSSVDPENNTVSSSDSSHYFGMIAATTVDKTASQTTISAGATVTYSYQISNTGNVPLSAITVSDDLCAPVNPTLNGGFNSGDSNQDNQLSLGELWHYTCMAVITGDTTNVATVTGNDPNGNPIPPSTDTEVVDVRPTVTLVKSVIPLSRPEPGGIFTYTLTISNTASEVVTITALNDSYPLSQSCLDLVGMTLPANQAISCQYTISHTDGGAFSNQASVTVVDDEGNPATDGDTTVALVDDQPPTIALDKSVTPSSLPEPGGLFTYTLTITNTASEVVTITAISDTYALSQDCQNLVGSSLLPSQSSSCHYTVTHGDAGSFTNQAAVTVVDNEGSSANDDDTTTVDVIDQPPTVLLDKSVAPTALPEPGGIFTYTLVISNTASEVVTITAINDIYPLSTACQNLVGTAIAVGQAVSCQYAVSHLEAGSYTNQASVTVVDNEGNPSGDDDSTTVGVTDSLPTIDLNKSVIPSSLPEPGGPFTYTLTFANTSPEMITITALNDTFALSQGCLGLLNTTIGVGQSVSCSYGVTHTEVSSYTNQATVTVVDNEGNPAGDDDNETVEVTDVVPEITLSKTASPTIVPEPGGSVTFTVQVQNISMETVILTSLIDNIHGDLNGQGSCAITQTLVPNALYDCSFNAYVAGNAFMSETDIITATVFDDEGTSAQAADTATVHITDVLPDILVTKLVEPVTLPEPGGVATFTVRVDNRTVETLTLQSLIDDTHGDLNGQGSCAVTQTIPVNQFYECHYPRQIVGQPGDSEHSTVTGAAQDDEGNPVSDDDSARVEITNIPSAIEILKLANRSSVNESAPGQSDPISFTVIISNVSQTDVVTITSVEDTIYGSITGLGIVNPLLAGSDCLVPQLLPLGASYACTFFGFIAANAGETHENQVVATGIDDDGERVTDNAIETVDVADIPSQITVVKSASPRAIFEPGAPVTFTVSISNVSPTDVLTLTTIIDSVYGDLTAFIGSTCAMPQLLNVGAGYSCLFSTMVNGNANEVHQNTVTVSAIDDDGNSLDGESTETVNILDVDAEIAVTKTASQSNLFEVAPTERNFMTFTVMIENISSSDVVTITELEDSIYGDLTLLSELITSSDCAVPQQLGVGNSYSCQFVGLIEGQPEDVHENVVTASGMDDDGNPLDGQATETVTILDVPSLIKVTKRTSHDSVPESGGFVTFTVEIENVSQTDAVTIDQISDTVYGDLTTLPDSSCTTPILLALNGRYLCTFQVFISGQPDMPHINTVSVIGTDDDGEEVDGSSTETVDIENLPSRIQVTKTADRAHVPEAGEVVQFALDVVNVSAHDVVTITSLTDSEFGDLTVLQDSDCTVPQLLQVGASYSCQFSAFISIDDSVGDTHVNVATAGGIDDDGEAVRDSDDASVLIADPIMLISKDDEWTTYTSPFGVDTNDIISYTIDIINFGKVPAINVLFNDAPDSNTNLIVGSVTTNQGTVLVGNNLGDQAVSIAVGDIPPSGSVRVTFSVRVGYDIPPSVFQLSNQGFTTGDNFPPEPSDDPRTPKPEDPTDTPLHPKPTAIQLAFFQADLQEANEGAVVALQWATITESNTWGYQIWRGIDDGFENAERITEKIILSAGSGGNGSTYSYMDLGVMLGLSYFYWLEESELDGTKSRYGPVGVSIEGAAVAYDLFLPMISGE